MRRGLHTKWVVVSLGMLVAGGAAGGEKKSLFIGIDGLRSDGLITAKTPHLDRLMQGQFGGGAYKGAFSPGAQIFQDVRHPPTSEFAHTSMASGVGYGRHGGNWQAYPHYVRILEKQNPSLNSAFLMNWNALLETSGADYVGCPKAEGDPQGEDSEACEQIITERMIGILHGTFAAPPGKAQHGGWAAGTDPDVLYIFYDAVDAALHRAPGALPTTPHYLEAIERTDQRIGLLLEALERRPNFAREDWQIVVASDHGGRGKSHSMHNPHTQTVPLLVVSKQAGQGQIAGAPLQMDVAATILDHMLGAAAVPAYFDGMPRGSAVLPPPKNLTEGLVAYYRFDGTLQDASGHGHTAAPGAKCDQPPVVHASGGKFGGYVRMDDPGGGEAASSYLTLGDPQSLKLGQGGSWTLTLWFKPDPKQDGSPVLLGNKDWSQGAAKGMALLAWLPCPPDGRAFTGLSLHAADGTQRRDAGSVPYALDDAWWFVAATISEAGNAVLHVGAPDGAFWILSHGVSPLTDWTSSLPLNLGQDGTGANAHHFAGGIDDLALWNRVLTLNELRTLFNGGAGRELHAAAAAPEP